MTRVPMWRCPDGGYCHHECERYCFRVFCCSPLTGEFPDDRWPNEVKEAHFFAKAGREADWVS